MGLYLSAEKKYDSKSPHIASIDLYSKDGRGFRIGFVTAEMDKVFQVLQTYTAIERTEFFFAFDYFKYGSAIEEKYNGWKLYDAFKEFKRQGIEVEPFRETVNFDVLKSNETQVNAFWILFS